MALRIFKLIDFLKYICFYLFIYLIFCFFFNRYFQNSIFTIIKDLFLSLFYLFEIYFVK